MDKKKRGWLVLSAICFGAAFLLLIALWVNNKRAEESLSQPSSDNNIIESQITVSSQEEYISPIDFTYWQGINEDIYAWIKVDGTNIDEPIMCSKTDDEFYLTHNAKKEYTTAGGIFSESYNGLNFDEPMTVVYGHDYYPTDSRFSQLHKYKSKAFFDENRKIDIFLPNCHLKYNIVAVYNNNTEHLLYNKDYYVTEEFNGYVNSILNTRDLEANLDTLALQKLTEKDKLLVLSTCNKNDSSTRFLVVAVLEN